MAGEPHERVLECVARPVVVQVIGVDVRHQGDGGVVEQERTVRFVGLDHEQLPRAGGRAHAEGAEHAAVDEARIGSEPQQRRDDHRRRGGLAVGARHRDQAVPLGQPGQRDGTVQHGEAGGPRREVFRVVFRDGAGDHDGVGTENVLGRVTDRHADAFRPERADGVGVPDVRPADRDACRDEKVGDAAHSGAADADEVDPPDAFRHGLRKIGLDH